MSLTINRIGGSGGVSENNAILIAHVPTGSTVTASKGGVTLTPKMWVSGSTANEDVAMFIFSPAQFDSVNPWTITATDGMDTAIDTVLITTNKEYEVEISYTLYLYKDGTILPALGTWSGKASYSNNPTVVDADGILTIIQDGGPCSKGNFANSISGAALLSGGNTLCFSMRVTAPSSSTSYSTQAKLGLFNRDLPGADTNYGSAENYAVYVYAMPRGETALDYTEFEVDISNISTDTNYYVGLIAVDLAGTIDKIYVM